MTTNVWIINAGEGNKRILVETKFPDGLVHTRKILHPGHGDFFTIHQQKDLYIQELDNSGEQDA